MKCEDFRTAIQGDALKATVSERVAVVRHFDSCKECAAFLTELSERSIKEAGFTPEEEAEANKMCRAAAAILAAHDSFVEQTDPELRKEKPDGERTDQRRNL